MKQPKLTVYPEKRAYVEPRKSASAYVSTYEKLTCLSHETGQSIPAIIQICVDFAMDHLIIAPAPRLDYEVTYEDEEKETE